VADKNFTKNFFSLLNPRRLEWNLLNNQFPL